MHFAVTHLRALRYSNAMHGHRSHHESVAKNRANRRGNKNTGGVRRVFEYYEPESSGCGFSFQFLGFLAVNCYP